MTKQIGKFWYLGSAVLLAAGITVGMAMRSHGNLGLVPAVVAAPEAGTPINSAITRGSYLVNQVAMCGDCHTPMDQDGHYIKSRWLQGAKISIKPTYPVRHWPHGAPGIAGLPHRWDTEDMIKFMTTGLNPRGHYAGPPMPAYRLDHADAVAVTAYLKSLPPGKMPPWMHRH